MALLNLTNHRDHPTNPAYVVFFYGNKDVADDFEILLAANGIHYERDQEDEGQQRHLFGVRKVDFKAADSLNYQAIGKHRSRFIPNTYFRNFVLIFTLLAIVLAIIGAIKGG